MKHFSFTTQGFWPQALLSWRYSGEARLKESKQRRAEAALCCQERELPSDGCNREEEAGGCLLGASSQVGDHINLT